MKSFLLCTSVCFFLLLVSCGKTDNRQKVDNPVPKIVVPNNPLEDMKFSVRPISPTEFVAQCLGSLMSAKTSNELPSFLADYRLDMDSRWRNVHRPFAMRESIFQAINDTNLLLLIIKKRDARYKKKLRKRDYTAYYNPETLPSIIYSNHDLAVRRYKQIKREGSTSK